VPQIIGIEISVEVCNRNYKIRNVKGTEISYYLRVFRGSHKS